MTYLLKNEVLQNQNTWHRGQIRIPPTLNEKLNEFAEKNDLSLNTAMITLIDQALSKKFHIQKYNIDKEDGLVMDLPTAVVALNSQHAKTMTLEQAGDKWMISYHGLRAVITNEEAQEMLDHGFEKVSYNKYQMSKPKRNVIFTEWNPDVPKKRSSIEHNEAVRMAASKYISEFLQNNPSYELIQIEFKKDLDKKGREFLYGVRIWYSYPKGE